VRLPLKEESLEDAAVTKITKIPKMFAATPVSISN
jgi:hypothetical protein